MASAVGERIRLRRQQLGLTQKQFGARVGASESAVVDWEKNRYFPSRHQGAVEDVLGISLTAGDDTPGPPANPRDREWYDLLLERIERMTPAEAVALIEEHKRRTERRIA